MSRQRPLTMDDIMRLLKKIDERLSSLESRMMSCERGDSNKQLTISQQTQTAIVKATTSQVLTTMKPVIVNMRLAIDNLKLHSDPDPTMMHDYRELVMREDEEGYQNLLTDGINNVNKRKQYVAAANRPGAITDHTRWAFNDEDHYL